MHNRAQSSRRRQACTSLLTLVAGSASAAFFLLSGNANAEDFSSSGQIRSLWEHASVNGNGPAAAANALQNGIIQTVSNTEMLEAEYHLSGNGMTAIATLHAHTPAGGSGNLSGWLNDLYQDANLADWQVSAGKKIVSWDVGFGFRPNDMVQQEQRRALINNTLIGRPLVMAEWFGADQALSVVWVNPGRHIDATNADSIQEQALAMRTYWRNGSLDWYGFARYGEQNGGSLGTAAAWVATDSTELHGSLRYLSRCANLTASRSGVLATSSPWQVSEKSNLLQALAGFTYTTADQHSWLIEYWYDGNAPDKAAWQNWNQRNVQLTQFASQHPALQAPAAANLAWQNNGFSVPNNLRQKNLYLRWSQQAATWQPAIDLLWTPEDHGYVSTWSMGWQGDRWHIDAGLRFYGGPATAIYAQLPTRRTAYLMTTWSF